MTPEVRGDGKMYVDRDETHVVYGWYGLVLIFEELPCITNLIPDLKRHGRHSQ